MGYPPFRARMAYGRLITNNNFLKFCICKRWGDHTPKCQRIATFHDHSVGLKSATYIGKNLALGTWLQGLIYAHCMRISLINK